MYVKDIVRGVPAIINFWMSKYESDLMISFTTCWFRIDLSVCTIHEFNIFALYNDFRSVVSSPYCNVIP